MSIKEVRFINIETDFMLSLSTKIDLKVKEVKKMAEFEGRCMKCKDKRKMNNPQATEIKKGTWAVKGKCPHCGTNMFKIVGKEKPKI